MRSRINHLIPIVTLSGNLHDSWKNIRSVIFNFVLERSTFPKESASLFKMGFYDIMVRPLIKVIDRYFNFVKDNEQANFLKTIATKAFITWISIENNQSEGVKSMVSNLSNGEWYSLLQWDKTVREYAFTRIFRGTNLSDLGQCVINLKKPNLLLYLSNARMHEISERLIKVLKSSSSDEKEVEKIKILEILKLYSRLYTLAKEVDHEAIDHVSKDLVTKTESYTLMTILIEQKIRRMEADVTFIANDCLKNIISDNTTWTEESGMAGLNLTVLNNVLFSFRKAFANCLISKYEELEIALEIKYTSKQDISLTDHSNVKRGPGRPKVIKTKDNNHSQTNLNSFVYKL